MNKIKLINKKIEEDAERFQKEEWKKFNKERNYKWKPKRFRLVALKEDKLVGYAKFKINGGASYLSEIIISKKARKSGIGKLLLNKFEEISKKQKCHIIYLKTSEKHKEAVNFYKRNNYKIVAKLKDNEFHFTWYFFEKRLK